MRMTAPCTLTYVFTPNTNNFLLSMWVGKCIIFSNQEGHVRPQVSQWFWPDLGSPSQGKCTDLIHPLEETIPFQFSHKDIKLEAWKTLGKSWVDRWRLGETYALMCRIFTTKNGENTLTVLILDLFLFCWLRIFDFRSRDESALPKEPASEAGCRAPAQGKLILPNRGHDYTPMTGMM